jgi:hypothetical protein
VTIVQENPMYTKKMKEINDNSPLKTDSKDPRVIADIIRVGHALSVVVSVLRLSDVCGLLRKYDSPEKIAGSLVPYRPGQV